MLLDVASEFIAMGEDIEDKQQYLNGAVSAWNIACLRGKERDAAIQRYRKQYRKMNPSLNKREINEDLENIQLLIDRKDKLLKFRTPETVRDRLSCRLKRPNSDENHH